MTNITVSDDKCLNVSCPRTTLRAGQSMICRCTTTLTETTTNIANVTAWYREQEVIATASATVNVTPA